MLSRLVVSLIILNICGVRLLCLWLQYILLLIVFVEKPLYFIWLYVSTLYTLYIMVYMVYMQHRYLWLQQHSL